MSRSRPKGELWFSILLVGQCSKPLIPIGWHIGQLTNPTLLWISMTPAAATPLLSLGKYTPRVISYQKSQKDISYRRKFRS